MSLPAIETDKRIAEEILRQVQARGSDKSICPSEVARIVAREMATGLTPDTIPAWQSLMGPVRRVAMGLAQTGRIDILRKGRPISVPDDPSDLKGVIRLRTR
jgi:hypothetical protein